ncbi:MAG: hypothetical protein RLY86_1602 [Pseudomonadota bacterium]|jgi:ParB family chromosome partitioning protein
MKLRKTDQFSRAMSAAAEEDPSLWRTDAPQLVMLDLESIRPRPDQPRRHFDDTALTELAHSIQRQGLLQPILVRRAAAPDAGYEIVAGERRWRAMRLNGAGQIPAILVRGDVDEIALVENLQRVDLTPEEEARGIGRLIETHGYTQDAAAAAIGWSRTAVNRILKVLELPRPILDECATLHVPRSALVEIALAEGAEERDHLMDLLRRGKSVAALRGARKPKSTRRAGEGEAQAPIKRFLSTLSRMEQELQSGEIRATALDEAQKSRLRQLRATLDTLLAE